MGYYEDEEYVSETTALVSESADLKLTPAQVKYVLDSAAQKLATWMRETAHKKVDKIIAEKTVEIFDAAARDVITEKAKVFLQDFIDKPRDVTNTYGEKTGQTVTFSERILKQWGDFMSQKVNARGEPGSYNDQTTRSEYMIRQIVDKDMKDATTAAVAQISAEAKKQVQAAVSRYVAEQLMPNVNLPQIPAAK